MDKIILHKFRKGRAVRIFRPWEIRKIIREIPKMENKHKFEALLHSGCRYTELQWLYENPNSLQSEHVEIKNTKAKVNEAYRWVRLNRQGQHAIENFLRCKTNLPSTQTWGENLKRWCTLAGIEKDGACAKSTRKTLESWLVLTYPNRVEEIFTSLGHQSTTALRHYLTFPFSKEDKREMLYFIDGW